MIGKARSAASTATASAAPGRSPVPAGRIGNPARSIRPASADERRPAPRSGAHDGASGETAKPAAGKNAAAGWGALIFFVVIVGLLGAAALLPIDRMLWAWTDTTEVTGRVTAIALESKRRRGRMSWFGPAYRISVKVAPYSFAFVVPCPAKERCEEQAAGFRPGQMVTLTVDKGAFDELKPKNRAIDRSSRDINRISQQMIRIEMDKRTVAMMRLVPDGQVILGGD